MATACLRLVTFFPDRPLRSVPWFISCMARSTFLALDLEYFLGTAGDSSDRKLQNYKIIVCRPLPRRYMRKPEADVRPSVLACQPFPRSNVNARLTLAQAG
jgi:hypothetical protein